MLETIAVLAAGAVPDTVDGHTVADEYGQAMALELETGLFMYGLVRRYHPRVVVETGAHAGYSGAWIAAALRDNHVDYPQHQKPICHSVEINETFRPRCESTWARAGVMDYVRWHCADSRTFVPPDTPVDFLWLDGSHETNDVVAEWQALAPYLNRDYALVGLHDTRLDPREAEAVCRVLSEKLVPIPDYHHIGHIPLRNQRGIDLIYLASRKYYERTGW